ncbi:MAG: hypothetical protein PQJ59_19190 [Spirochaetales bacterium]|nr:hypothetical protein [Spirochaetales bacterium]
MKKAYPLILLLISFLVSCKSFSTEGQYYSAGKSAARSAKYDVAVENLVQAIHLDREFKKAILLLDEVYPEGLEYYRGIIRLSVGRNDLEALDNRAASYSSLVAMVSAVENFPKIEHPKTGENLSFERVDYSVQKEEALLKAAEGYYQEGIRLASLKAREDSKAASKAFLKCLGYIPDYKDAGKRELNARSDASQQLLFIPFSGENYSRPGMELKDILLESISTAVLNDSNAMEYTTVIDRSLLELTLEEQKALLTGLYDEEKGIELGRLVSANMVFTGTISLISWDDPKLNMFKEHREKIVSPTASDLGRAPTEGETLTVSGVLNYHEQRSYAQLSASYKLIDIERGTILLNETFRSEAEDTKSWILLQGDQRVLTEEEREMLTLTDRDVKEVDQLLLECVDSIAHDMAFQLIGYLR